MQLILLAILRITYIAIFVVGVQNRSVAGQEREMPAKSSSADILSSIRGIQRQKHTQPSLKALPYWKTFQSMPCTNVASDTIQMINTTIAIKLAL